MNTMETSTWRDPPPDLRLADPDVHLWRASLLQPSERLEQFRATLSQDEAERAGRFHFPSGRDGYIVGRGVLRMLLSRYLAVRARDIVLDYTPHGKPFLKAGVGPRVEFNLAHSGVLLVLAFSLGRRVGVDIERLRPDFAGQRIADRFFSPRESEALRALPKDQHERAFIRCWTQKEAYIKARGEGLSFPLHDFDVTVDPNEPAALVSTQHDPQEVNRWTLRSLEVPDEYEGAVAVEGKGLRFFSYEL